MILGTISMQLVCKAMRSCERSPGEWVQAKKGKAVERKPSLVEVRRLSFSLPLHPFHRWHSPGIFWMVLQKKVVFLITSLGLHSFHSRITLKIMIRYQPESPLVIRDTQRGFWVSRLCPPSRGIVVPLYPKQMQITVDSSAGVTEKRSRSPLTLHICRISEFFLWESLWSRLSLHSSSSTFPWYTHSTGPFDSLVCVYMESPECLLFLSCLFAGSLKTQ